MALSTKKWPIFLLYILLFVLNLVPYSNNLLQGEESPVLPSVIEDQQSPNPSRHRDDSNAQRLKVSSQLKPEQPVTSAETERDLVLERYRETKNPADSDQDGAQQDQDDSKGEGDTYMTVVGDDDDLETVEVIPPLLSEENAFDDVYDSEANNEGGNIKILEGQKNRNGRKHNHHKQFKKHRNKNHKRLLRTKELLFHPHSIQMQDALEHFKTVMQKLGNVSDILQHFRPTKEINKKTHSFIKKLRKLKKVSHNKVKGSRSKRQVPFNPPPLSHHSIQYLKSLGFTKDDLKFYGLKDSGIFRPAGSGKDDLSYRISIAEELSRDKLKRKTAETLHRTKRISRLRRSKRSTSENLRQSRRLMSLNLARSKISDSEVIEKRKKSDLDDLTRSKRSVSEDLERSEESISSSDLLRNERKSNSVETKVKEDVVIDTDLPGKVDDVAGDVVEKVTTNVEESSTTENLGPSSAKTEDGNVNQKGRKDLKTADEEKHETSALKTEVKERTVRETFTTQEKDAQSSKLSASSTHVTRDPTITDHVDNLPQASPANTPTTNLLPTTTDPVPLASHDDATAPGDEKDTTSELEKKSAENLINKTAKKTLVSDKIVKDLVDSSRKVVLKDSSDKTTSPNSSDQTISPYSSDQTISPNSSDKTTPADSGNEVVTDSSDKTNPSDSNDKVVLKDTDKGAPKNPGISGDKVTSNDPENSEGSADATFAKSTPEVEAPDCSDSTAQNGTDCSTPSSNFVMNIAIIRTIMKDRSKDAVYGMLSLGLIVGTVLLAVLYTRMWRTRREGWFTSTDQNHTSHVKIQEVLKSKAKYLPMFHKKWKKGNKYESLEQEDDVSSEDELFDKRQFTNIHSYDD